MNDIPLPATATADISSATLRARAGGYALDMLLFAAIAMLVIGIAGFILLFSTSPAKHDATNRDFYRFFGMIGIGVPVLWTLLSIGLLFTRSRTGGQYVAGVRVVRADGRPLSRRSAMLWWFCFNPLLLSWPMAIVAGVPLTLIVAPVLGPVTILLFGVLLALCIVTPIVAAVSAALDAQNRTLQERLIGTRVVRDD